MPPVMPNILVVMQDDVLSFEVNVVETAEHNEKATTWNVAAQELPKRQNNSKWPTNG